MSTDKNKKPEPKKDRVVFRDSESGRFIDNKVKQDKVTVMPKDPITKPPKR